MKVVRFAYEGGEGARVGILEGDEILDFSAAYRSYRLVLDGCQEPMYSSLSVLMEEGLFARETFDAVVEFVDEHALREVFTVEQARLLAPVERPPKIIALGRNYLAHARESGHEAPREPIVFEKASSSVVGPDEPVVYKEWMGRVDPEVELGVVIGQRGSDVSEADALEYVAGYTVVNDVTAREMQSRDLDAANPWWRSKSIDTFCPLGPCVTLREEIGSSIELDLEMRVNGEVRQKDNTANLLFKIPTIISFISRFVSLEPGDVIATGTPSGIAPVKPGDVMEAIVEKIGVLRNPVVGG